MPVIVTVLLFGLLLSVFAIGAWAGSDQATRRLMLRIVLFSTVATLLLVWWLFSGPAEPPITNAPPQPTVSPAEACATGSLVDCSAACGGLAGDIRSRLDDAERRALEQEYERDCSQFGPLYDTSAPPP
jgi:hypothetical protein